MTEPTRGNRASDYMGEDDPPAVERARELLCVYDDATRELSAFIFGMAYLSGTHAMLDGACPINYVPQFWVVARILGGMR